MLLVLLIIANMASAETVQVQGGAHDKVLNALSADCKKRLQQIELAARLSKPALEINRFMCQQDSLTIRLREPFQNKTHSELIVPEAGGSFREHVYPNSGDSILIPEHVGGRAVEFYYPLRENGEFDTFKSTEQMREITARTYSKERTWDETLQNWRNDYWETWGKNKNLPGQPSSQEMARLKRKHRLMQEAEEKVKYVWRGGYLQDPCGSIAKPGTETAVSQEKLYTRAETYSRLVQTVFAQRFCQTCGKDLNRIAPLNAELRQNPQPPSKHQITPCGPLYQKPDRDGDEDSTPAPQ